ncbi:uncharacterized protein LAESUDRAFT_733605 [Laetiporus sulphureus 93-53]|uniref:GST N-terminal domain-containing protein n=1 Tax=Laetiporus sulphureus 93-53 TaxID=1314785 RepID=A0A165IGY9_9APHY|nr:uncharacterized protein LAESUDRAFT_733605 [Laetiporus sulphureus 93-53]KZT13057.1 hypothetical protein LAESUDRAFT_733605 [Laetiporus sulphureus 93-53]
MSAPVVLYHFLASPFANKIRNVLALKGIPHQRVEVVIPTTVPPRPELSELLGVTYRRTPTLAIGNDVYCDSSMIVTALERRFPSSVTLFPPRKGTKSVDKASIIAVATFWFEGVIFPAVSDHLPYETMPVEYLQDRSVHRGAPIDIPAIQARRDDTKSTLSSHLYLLEQQLTDEREWVMDTESPSLADVSVHFLIIWMQNMKTLDDLFDKNTLPNTLAWFSRMNAHVESAKKANANQFTTITGEAAATLIGGAQAEDLSVIGFDETEAARLKVKLGDIVSVTPRDNGKVPTVGKLLALNREEVVIETKGSTAIVRCHFPRLGFSVKEGRA